MAFGLSDLNSQKDSLEDPRYGQLEAIAVSMLADGTIEQKTIGSESCSEEFLSEAFYKADKHT